MPSGLPSAKGLIVVTGATGRQGGAVARRLVAEGWVVRGLTRDPESEKAAALQRAGVQLVQGDMGNRSSLAEALRGATGLYSVQNGMISGYEMELVQGRNVADASLEAGVHHVVYGSAGPGRPGTGVKQWDGKLEIEEHMRRIGLRLTILRPMAFMELMTDKAFYPGVSTWHVMPKLLGWDRPVVWVSVEDLATIAATAFARPDDFAGRDLAIAGDLKSLAECRALWSEVTGRPPRSFPMPVPVFERFVDKDLTRMWRWLDANPIDVDLGPSREIHPTMLTVRDWLLKQRGGGAGRG